MNILTSYLRIILDMIEKRIIEEVTKSTFLGGNKIDIRVADSLISSDRFTVTILDSETVRVTSNCLEYIREQMILETKMCCYDILTRRLIPLKSKSFRDIYCEYQKLFGNSTVYFEGMTFKNADIHFDLFVECFTEMCKNFYLTFRT